MLLATTTVLQGFTFVPKENKNNIAPKTSLGLLNNYWNKKGRKINLF